jgi:hypothetical protein
MWHRHVVEMDEEDSVLVPVSPSITSPRFDLRSRKRPRTDEKHNENTEIRKFKRVRIVTKCLRISTANDGSADGGIQAIDIIRSCIEHNKQQVPAQITLRRAGTSLAITFYTNQIRQSGRTVESIFAILNEIWDYSTMR